jgi:hypothetical protein
MRIRSQQNFWSGVMFIAIGIFFAGNAVEYSMGTAAKMGPGYFPFWLGVILALLGVVIGISGLSPKAQEAKVEGWDFRVMFLVLGSVILFGALLRPLGIFVSIVILVVLSSLASHEFNWKVAVINALCLAVFAWAVFVKGLGLIFPLWPTFLGLN